MLKLFLYIIQLRIIHTQNYLEILYLQKLVILEKNLELISLLVHNQHEHHKVSPSHKSKNYSIKKKIEYFIINYYYY